MLLEYGTNVDAINLLTGQTALHLAARDGDESLTELLLSKGACVSSRSNVGGTPLHVSRSWSFHHCTAVSLG